VVGHPTSRAWSGRSPVSRRPSQLAVGSVARVPTSMRSSAGCVAAPPARPVRSVAPVSAVVGVLEQVLVYPVKSLRGQALGEVRIDAGGLRGDRAYAVVDAVTGEPVRAKAAPHLRELPATGDAGADAVALGAVLGRPVRLAAADGPRGDAAVHLVSRQAVDRAGTGHVPAGCSAEDPRANLVMALHPDGDERTWVGRELRVGEVVLRLTRLPKHCLGVYAEVVAPGLVRVGDEVRLDDGGPAAPG
jgi:hypothetical protein